MFLAFALAGKCKLFRLFYCSVIDWNQSEIDPKQDLEEDDFDDFDLEVDVCDEQQ